MNNIHIQFRSVARCLLAALCASTLISCSPPKEKDFLLEETPEPGVWKNSIDMKFRKIPGTNILMSVYETRIQDFTAFVNDTGYDATKGLFYYKNRSWHQDTNTWANPGFRQTNSCPVTGVNWRDAVAFCLWLTDVEQQKGEIKRTQAYRLPTEKEWAMAAGTRDTIPPYPEAFGNYNGSLEFDFIEFTTPAGLFAPSENGFYDLAGNVWEFTLDKSAAEDEFRIICGGCWQNWHDQFVGMNARGRCSTDIRITLYGFRVVLAPNDAIIVSMRNDAMRVDPLDITPPP